MQKNRLTFLFIILFLRFNFYGFSQTSTISGTVSDPNGTPLTSVQIRTSDNSVSTTTDADGYYSIELSNSANYYIIFELDGDYKDQVSWNDVSKIYLYIVDKLELSEIAQIAADVTGDGVAGHGDDKHLSEVLINRVAPMYPVWKFVNLDNPSFQDIINLQADRTINVTGVKMGNVDCY